jgi:hypothetical protein
VRLRQSISFQVYIYQPIARLGYGRGMVQFELVDWFDCCYLDLSPFSVCCFSWNMYRVSGCFGFVFVCCCGIGVLVFVLYWFDGIEWMCIDALFFSLCGERSPYNLADLVLFHELKGSYQSLLS